MQFSLSPIKPYIYIYVCMHACMYVCVYMLLKIKPIFSMAADPIQVELSHASLDPRGTPRVDHTQK